MEDEKLAGNAEEENVDDAVISMVDYLKEEQELADDADAVLGDSDETQCTFQLVTNVLWFGLKTFVLRTWQTN